MSDSLRSALESASILVSELESQVKVLRCVNELSRAGIQRTGARYAICLSLSLRRKTRSIHKAVLRSLTYNSLPHPAPTTFPLSLQMTTILSQSLPLQLNILIFFTNPLRFGIAPFAERVRQRGFTERVRQRGRKKYFDPQ